ncbi:MAG: hypothetical protein V4684_07655 [Pseudomonadota bacterium]
MALSPDSLAEVAHRKAQRAREKVANAEGELKSANRKLEKAIPRGDTNEIQSAHTLTQKAEHEVVAAGEELQVVESLLEAHTAPESDKSGVSGEGLKSLIEKLARQKASR